MDRQQELCHNVYMKLLTAVCFLMMVSQAVPAREYRTSALRSAAAKLGIKNQIDNALSNTTTNIIVSDNKTVTIRLDEYGNVSHIGLLLFSPEMRKQRYSPVCDCLEYAALDRCFLLSENDLLLQKIKFFKGSWYTVYGIQPTDACSIGTLDDRFYQVIWKRNGTDIVNIVIPVDYELLSNCSRRELETNLLRDIIQQPIKSQQYCLPTELLQRTEKDDVYVLPGKSFLMDGLTRNTYYRKGKARQQEDNVSYEGEEMNVIIDQRYPAETMANLLLNLDSQLPDVELHLDIRLSSTSRQNLNITLRQWISYCENEGCIPYFSYDDTETSYVKGYLLMHNEGMGYNHLLTLKCSIEDLISETPSFTGKALLYIPNIEASKMFVSEEGVKANKKKFK